jgi:uncharacterized membrane protein YphA (DoxX/SURF4 family)
MKTQTKGMNVTLWVLQGLIAATFFVAGITKFAGGMNEEFLAWGYSLGFAIFVGIVEVVCAIGLLFKRAAGWSALVLMVIMLGAMWTHGTYGEFRMLALPIVVFLLLGVVAWGRGLSWESRRRAELPRTAPPPRASAPQGST